MQKALYRKYRSKNFDEVYGQEHITSVLKYECASGSISHAYLFCGSRGTGKTSCAKILAKAANCLDSKDGNPCGVCSACRAIDEGFATDVLEMDAASNNGVDNIRDLRDEVVFAPSVLKYRVYIIDEVHMLSQSAFNALLKTLEEPPEHCIFILATTELHKLPSTIISRCQRFDFRRISIDNISKRLNFIADKEGIEIDSHAAFAIAKFSAGGMRDAISLFELCSSTSKKITLETVESVIGSGGRDTVESLVRALHSHDYGTILSTIHSAVMGSRELKVLWEELIDYYRDMLICKYSPDPMKYLDLTDVQMKTLSENADKFTKADILYHTSLLDSALYEMTSSPSSKRAIAELTLIRICDSSLDSSYEALLKRVEALEGRIKELSLNPPASPTVLHSKEPEPSHEEHSSIPENKPEEEPTKAKEEIKIQEKPKEQEKQASKTLRFRQSAELCEILKNEGDFMLASFTDKCKICTAGDGFIITAPEGFTAGRMNFGKEKLARLFSSLTGRRVSESNIEITVGDVASSDPFDEL